MSEKTLGPLHYTHGERRKSNTTPQNLKSNHPGHPPRAATV